MQRTAIQMQVKNAVGFTDMFIVLIASFHSQK